MVLPHLWVPETPIGWSAIGTAGGRPIAQSRRPGKT